MKRLLCSALLSAVATLAYAADPDISNQPQDLTNCPGTTASFSVGATGGSTLSFQWYTNDVAVGDGSEFTGATTDTLTINPVGQADALSYSVVVTDDAGSITSSVVTLTVLTNVSATALTSLTNCPGTSATFSTVASGTGPFAYQWFTNGVTLGDGGEFSGSATDTLTVNPVTAADALIYSVVVNGACGSVTNSASLTVLTNVSATALTSLTNCPGTSATFTTVASGTGPFAYQWYTNGVALGDGGEFSGSVTATLTVNLVTAVDALTYSVVVGGACGIPVTNSAVLTVLTNVSATALTSLTNCPGTSATFTTVASGTGPFSYVWKKDGAVLTGETGSSFTTNNVSAVSSGTYTVEVSGACGNPVTNSATLTVFTNVSATALTSLTNCPGTSATFTTVASGTGPFAYQWYTNGVALGDGGEFSGSVTATLTVNPVTVVDALTYSVVVGGACGSVTNSASLTVLTNVSTTALTSLTNCPGTSATFSTVASGTGPFAYQWFTNGVTLGDGGEFSGSATDTLTVNPVTAADALIYSVVVNGACGSVTNSASLTVLTNVSATALTSLTNCPGTSATFTTVASGTGPFAYQWYTNGVALGDGGEFSGSVTATLTVNPVAAVDALTYSVVVGGACGIPVTNSATLTVNTNVSATALTSLTNCPGTSATFTTVASGTAPYSYVWKKDGAVLAGETGSSFTTNNVSAVSSGTYTVEVSGACGNPVTNSATLTVFTNVSATALTSLTNCPGTSATFTTVASGTGPFAYQWFTNGVALGDGGEFSGSVTATLTVNPVTAVDALTYSVVVGGACGSVTNSATLTVLTNVSATALTSLTNCPGTSATFSTVASGTGPFAYQWFTNGVTLGDGGEFSGSVTATLTVNPVTAADALIYSVVVNGACGSVTNSASLTVITNVSATALTSLTNCPGTSATFSTVASGTGPFAYQWFTNGVALGDGGEFSGSVTATLTVNPVAAVDALTYSVVVSGACGIPVTNSATLTVNTNVSATALTSLTNCPGTSATFTTVATGTAPFSYLW